MRSYPDDEWDLKELNRLNAETWQTDMLRLNPDYTSWGPGEDYMASTKDEGWGASKVHATWAEFGPWHLDDLNELVHFYFEVNRENMECPSCRGSGYNPETEKISEAFYNLDRRSDLTRWCDEITEDEVQALWAENRLKFNYKTMPTAAQVNADQNVRGAGFRSHDAINRGILIEARAKRLGVWGLCPECSGRGRVYTAPTATLGITLWLLHPRKGCSRGVRITAIERTDIPSVLEYLKTAAERARERFSKALELHQVYTADPKDLPIILPTVLTETAKIAIENRLKNE